MARRNVERREPITRGTGNVFPDLGFPDPAERQAKLRLAYALNHVLEERKLSQADASQGSERHAAQGLCASSLQAGGLSVERLMNLLTALDQDVEIVIRRKPARGKLVGLASSRLERHLRYRMPTPVSGQARTSWAGIRPCPGGLAIDERRYSL